MPYNLILILGPTASGKTELASHLAMEIKGEVISADSRQVYKGMDIGTGKDLKEYQIGDVKIPYHLIDIKEASEDFNLFDFQTHYYQSLKSIWDKGKNAIVCGGSGMYLDRTISAYELNEVPLNQALRDSLSDKSITYLKEILSSYRLPHNETDTKDKERALRAIEIADFESKHQSKNSMINEFIVFGIDIEREILRERIKIRLDSRLKEGLIEEVKDLLKSGLSHERLRFFGLEYAFISLYLAGDISYEEMYNKLLQGIRRFAKRQMTWYRRMEKKGIRIHWIDYKLPLESKLKRIKEYLDV